MKVNMSWLREALHVATPPERGEIECAFTFTPWAPISSWSIDHDTAADFASTVDHRFAVVLTAKTEGNKYLIIGPGGLYGVRGFDIHSPEKEMI